jgi:hypothetical protein
MPRVSCASVTVSCLMIACIFPDIGMKNPYLSKLSLLLYLHSPFPLVRN